MAPLSMAHRTPLLAILGLAFPLLGQGQYFRSSAYWKTHRQELSLGVGISNFLGELGGRDRIGTPFIWDLEMSRTRPSLSAGYRYYLAQTITLRFSATYAVLSGDDALTKEPFRQNRNLNFTTDLLEGQLCMEWMPYQERPGHIYDLRGVTGLAPSRFGLYFFAGVGVFHFDPKTSYNGHLVALQPLGTEGQGLPDGPEEYSLTQFCIPMGAGVRKGLSKTITVGLELQYTKTFTDHIDDVSGLYYDRQAILDARGPVAAHLSDPSLGDIPGQTATGQERGHSEHNDGYLFLKAQLHYKIYKSADNKRYRTRLKKQRIEF
jgi:hypothetical protein